jgi:hypothetical protein
VYFSGIIARPLRSNALDKNPLFNKSNAHVLAALTLLGTFRVITDNPLPTELLPAVSFACGVKNRKGLKVGRRFYNRKKLLSGIMNVIEFKVSE